MDMHGFTSVTQALFTAAQASFKCFRCEKTVTCTTTERDVSLAYVDTLGKIRNEEFSVPDAKDFFLGELKRIEDGIADCGFR